MKANVFLYYVFQLVLIVGVLFLHACGGNGGDSGENMGALALQLIFPEDIPRKDSGDQGTGDQPAGSIDCKAAGIELIRSTVVNGNGEVLKQSQSQCDSGRSALTGIVAGSGFRISVIAEDGVGETLLYGEEGNVTIQAGRTITGQIVLSYVDSDQDGFNIKQDCDDKNAAIFPGAEEICGDEIDQNCDAEDSMCDENLDPSGSGEPESEFEEETPVSEDESGSETGDETPVSEAESELDSFRNNLGMTFNRIPAGTFVMGSPLDEQNRMGNEVPHEVTLRSFYIQTTEVTQGQWMEVMGNENPSEFDYCGLRCPVEMVSWEDAQLFISRMNTRGEGTYHLPTEAEWEYAARGGFDSAFANGGGAASTECTYDSDLDSLGWYCYNSDGLPHEVAQKLPNGFGLFDVHGNVWEWCRDYYAPFSDNAVSNPQGPPSGTHRVVRGGAWPNTPQYCRLGNRSAVTPDTRGNNLGFRLVWNP